ncbi:MAG TPA: hypothetical protein DCG12_13270, partial [Planctomycetaceae bacterium]|nr:hypothetical protein [Planctomycetaceae bacterium]
GLMSNPYEYGLESDQQAGQPVNAPGRHVGASSMRFWVIGATTLAAVALYLDRICIAEIAKLDDFRTSLGMSEKQVGGIMSAFFFTYALCQVPAG